MNHTTTPFVQPLERRELFAVTVTFDKGVLFVRGSELADTIHVRQANNTLSVIGTGKSFPASQVKSIVVDARGGNDDIYIYNPLKDPTADYINKPAILVGGSGNDTIVGSFGRDLLVGNDGNDSLFGTGGDDVLLGGLGDDSLHAGDGNDLVFAGLGNDTLDGWAGDDVLYGDAGADSIAGNDGNDLLLGSTGFDTLSGGSGNNLLVDFIGDYTRVIGIGGNDSFANPQRPLPSHKVFKPFRSSATLPDLDSLSQRLPTRGKTARPLSKLLGKNIYEALFTNKAAAKFLGVGAKTK